MCVARHTVIGDVRRGPSSTAIHGSLASSTNNQESSSRPADKYERVDSPVVFNCMAVER